MLHIKAPFAQSISARLGCPIVVYDIEHTGGKREVRGIVELACVVVTADTIYEGVNTLVNPGDRVEYNPHVTRITGIHKSTVSRSPSWRDACADFVIKHDESIWCGFNSRSCDAPVIRDEHGRLGLQSVSMSRQMDVMSLSRMAGLQGNLSSLVMALAPHAVKKAHRAMGDVLMTLALLEALSGHATDLYLENEQLIPRRRRAAKPMAA